MKTNMSNEDLINVENKITNPNWIKISKTLRFNEVRPLLVEYLVQKCKLKTKMYCLKYLYTKNKRIIIIYILL